MEYKEIENDYEDERGIIKDILAHEPVDAITYITSVKGSTRANHYHKKTIQWTYLLSGRMQYLSRYKEEDLKVTILKPGDLIKSEEYESHALIALEDSEMMIFTRGPRGGKEYETDTYRLKETLKG